MVYDFSSRLIQLRKARKWTQKELGDRIKISDSAIGSYENDVADPSFQIAAALADVFNISLDYLAEGSKSKTITVKGLSERQIQLLTQLGQELSHPTSHGANLSPTQKDLLAGIISEFVSN